MQRGCQVAAALYCHGMPTAPLDRLRAMCLALPVAHEVEAWGEPTFRVKNKLSLTNSRESCWGVSRVIHSRHGQGFRTRAPQ